MSESNQNIKLAVDNAAPEHGIKAEPLLPQDFNEQPYPLEALGDICGLAAKAMAENAQSPLAVAGQCVLSALSLAAQPFANVIVKNRKTPLSLFCLTISDSGDRKTTTDKMALAPHYAYQRELQKNYKQAKDKYLADKKAYTAAEKAILGRVKNESPEVIAQQLLQLQEPEKPIEPLFICSEPTFEGLVKSFERGLPGQGLYSDEGGQFFGGHAMNADNAAKTIGGLSKIWDGSTIIRTRAKDDESSFLDNRRLSAHLMVQPIISNKIFQDPLLKEQGILARFFVSHPKSLAGTRFISPVEQEETDNDKKLAIQKYNKLIADLLKRKYETDESGGIIFEKITLDKTAYDLWAMFFNRIEEQLSEGGQYNHMKPTAQKMAENTIRIAGIFAVVEGTEQINFDQMTRAVNLGSYYLEQYQLAMDKAETDTEMVNANTLLKWFKAKEMSIISITDLNKAPRSTGARKRQIGRELMDLLTLHGYTLLIEKNKNGESCKWRLIN